MIMNFWSMTAFYFGSAGRYFGRSKLKQSVNEHQTEVIRKSNRLAQKTKRPSARKSGRSGRASRPEAKVRDSHRRRISGCIQRFARDGKATGEVVGKIRALFKRPEVQQVILGLNSLIGEEKVPEMGNGGLFFLELFYHSST